MANRKPLIDANGEVRELTAEDMGKFRPAAEVLPSSLKKKLGEGWQTRVDAALRDRLRNHSPA